MELDRYRRFTATLTQTLSAHGDVVGLVAMEPSATTHPTSTPITTSG